MWRKDGTKLSGYYGTWNGREIELSRQGVYNGKLRLIQDGGDSPGPEWKTRVTPNRFARTPVRHWLEVEGAEVKNIHAIEVFGFIDSVRVRLISEREGRLAVEAGYDNPPNFRDQLAEKHGFERLDWAHTYGWVPAEDVHEITIERRDITKD